MAQGKQIELAVITPEREVLEATAESVVVPSHDGELGVLNQRAPLMCELGIGQLRYEAAGRERRVFIDGGFAQVFENRVTVLTKRAVPAEDVTSEVVDEAARSVAEQTGTGPEEVLDRERAQRRLSVLRAMQRSE
jgi:F-type H+-transporting ATPase subunit epsilon